MGRIEQPPRDRFTGEELADHDAVVERMTRMRSTVAELKPVHDDRIGGPALGDYWGALLQSPPLAHVTIRMGRFVRTAADRGDTYSHADREFVDQVLAAEWGTNLVQGHHVPDAIATGVRLEAIEALRAGDDSALTDDERLLARYIRAVVAGTVDDELHAAMEARLGARGVVEYAAFILWLGWILRMMQAVGCPEPDDAETAAQIEGIRNGTVAVPDFRERIS